jgi:hypothetical protein
MSATLVIPSLAADVEVLGRVRARFRTGFALVTGDDRFE